MYHNNWILQLVSILALVICSIMFAYTFTNQEELEDEDPTFNILSVRIFFLVVILGLIRGAF